jgi:hypothetical protein
MSISISSAKIQSPAAVSGAAGVPWPTVLSLAALMAFADGYWMISLRGAVGAIERTQSPFASWLRESTLVLVPVFVFAVLAALTFARRRFGPVLDGPRAVLTTMLLVAGAGTLAGLLAMAGNAVYDYRLQSHHLGMMSTMGGLCFGACQAHQYTATIALHLKAIAVGTGLCLVSNLALVAWAWAIRGGRLTLTTSRAHGRPRIDSLPLLLVVGLIAGAGVHAAVIPEHLSEWAAAGVFFALLTAAQVAVAGLLLARPGRTTLLAAAAVSIVPILLWLDSRTLGLPFGPGAGTPERIGLADTACTLLEILTLLIAVVLLRTRGRSTVPSMSPQTGRLAMVAVVAVAAIGLGGSGLTLFNAFDIPASSTHSTH